MTKCKAGNGICDPSDVCKSGSCMEALAAEGVTCSGSPTGDCDLQDTCNGQGACIDCIKDISVVCHPAMSTCDVPEACNGGHACPADSFITVGSSCGSDADTECNNPDTCDGLGKCLTNFH